VRRVKLASRWHEAGNGLHPIHICCQAASNKGTRILTLE
jgi:hypothetical protein